MPDTESKLLQSLCREALEEAGRVLATDQAVMICGDLRAAFVRALLSRQSGGTRIHEISCRSLRRTAATPRQFFAALLEQIAGPAAAEEQGGAGRGSLASRVELLQHPTMLVFHDIHEAMQSGLVDGAVEGELHELVVQRLGRVLFTAHSDLLMAHRAPQRPLSPSSPLWDSCHILRIDRIAEAAGESAARRLRGRDELLSAGRSWCARSSYLWYIFLRLAALSPPVAGVEAGVRLERLKERLRDNVSSKLYRHWQGLSQAARQLVFQGELDRPPGRGGSEVRHYEGYGYFSRGKFLSSLVEEIVLSLVPESAPPPWAAGQPMAGEENGAASLRVFCAYSHRDEDLRDQLEDHLSTLKHEGVLSLWYDRKISAGHDWAATLGEELETADIVLLLVSASFLASSYCFGREARRALERHAEGSARVIPVILRPADWETSALGALQALPKDARPVVAWPLPDEALVDVARGLRTVALELRGGTPRS